MRYQAAPLPEERDSKRPDERAADGNRTRIIALEGRGSTVELPPHARILRDERFCDGDSLHKRRRTGHLVQDSLPVPVSESLADVECLFAAMIEFQDDQGRSRHSPCTDECGRMQPGTPLVGRRLPACAVALRLCTTGDWQRNAPACRRLDRNGSSCPSVRVTCGATRIPRATCSPCSDHTFSARREFSLTKRTYVRFPTNDIAHAIHHASGPLAGDPPGASWQARRPARAR